MIRSIIGVLLFFSATALYSQSFTPEQWDVISLNILNQYSENVKLRADAETDSITIVNFYASVASLQKALGESEQTISALHRITGDNDALVKVYTEEIKKLKKEIRKQKFLKWSGLTLAAVFAFLAVN